MKAFISKYALTVDTYEVEGELQGRVFSYLRKGVRQSLIWADEAWPTKEQAIAAAERIRLPRAAKIEKELKKIKSLINK